MTYLSLFISIVLVASTVFYLAGFDTPLGTYANVTLGINNGITNETDMSSGTMLNPGAFLPGMIWYWITSNWLTFTIAGVMLIGSAVVFGGAILNNPIVTKLLSIVLLVIVFNVFVNPIAPIFSAFDVIGTPWNILFFLIMNILMILAYLELAQGGGP